MNGSPTLERSHLHDDGRSRAAPGFDLRFDHRAARSSGGRRFQFHHFRLQRPSSRAVDRSQFLSSPKPAQQSFRRPSLPGVVPAPGVASSLVDIRRGKIDLVDRDHDLHVRRGFGVIDRFDRLRHEAVVGRDNKHDDVGHVRAARAHRREGGVTGRVEKSDASCLCNRRCRRRCAG